MKRVYAVLIPAAALASVVAPEVFAALPAEVDTALASVQTDMLAMIGKGFAIVGVISALWLVLGGFKKIIHKSGS